MTNKKRRGTGDTRETTSDIVRQQNQDATRTAIQPTFEGTQYTVPILQVIDWVNVKETIGAGQTNAPPVPQPPPQTTGLSGTVISNTQINLSWTSNPDATVTNYEIWQSGTTGTESFYDTSITNSYSDTGLTAGTAYYYKVLAVNPIGSGPLSTELTKTTTGTAPPPAAKLWLKFDGNYVDSSTFGNTVVSSNTSGFAGSGQFGTNSVLLNTSVTTDHVNVTDNTNIQSDWTTGFSYSFWIYKTANTGLQYLFIKQQDTSNGVVIFFDSANLLSGVVMEASTQYRKSLISTLSLNTWHHIVLTFDASTNTLNLYVDKVAATTTTGSAYGFGTFPTANLVIGTASDFTTGFKGRIDEFQYFKGVVLTQTQVNNLFATNAP